MDENGIDVSKLVQDLNRDEPFGVRFRYNALGQVVLPPSQAKALLDWVHRHYPSPNQRTLAQQCIEATKTSQHNKIAAIKEYRTRTNASLKEALDAINRVWPYSSPEQT